MTLAPDHVALVDRLTDLLKALVPAGKEPHPLLRSHAEMIATMSQSPSVEWRRRWVAAGPQVATRAIEKLRLAAESGSLYRVRIAVSKLPEPSWAALYNEGLNMAEVERALSSNLAAERLTPRDLDQIAIKSRLAETKSRNLIGAEPRFGRPTDLRILGLALFTLRAFEDATGKTASVAGDNQDKHMKTLTKFALLMIAVFEEACIGMDATHYADVAVRTVRKQKRDHKESQKLGGLPPVS